MSHAFLSSADKMQWFSAVLSNICSRSGFMVSTAGHKKVTMFVLADVFHSSGVLVHPLAVRRSPTDDFL
jgi:hypothetical protein